MKTHSKNFRAIYSDYAKADAAQWAKDNGHAVVAITAEQLTGAADGFNDWVATLEYAEKREGFFELIVRTAEDTAEDDRVYTESDALAAFNGEKLGEPYKDYQGDVYPRITLQYAYESEDGKGVDYIVLAVRHASKRPRKPLAKLTKAQRQAIARTNTSCGEF